MGIFDGIYQLQESCCEEFCLQRERWGSHETEKEMFRERGGKGKEKEEEKK